ncbi:MAG TPA: HD domain-containing phosphohydrolase [Gaiellaceae bacterium]|nr:HD domain-containing phosphohydrolase [Gaiellaceae bacterium]
MTPLLRNRAIAAATLSFLAVTAVAMGLAFAGSDVLQDRRASVPILLALLVAGVFALLGWATERARREELELEQTEERARVDAERARREDELGAEQDRLRAELADVRARTEADRARREEVERELRAQLEGQERANQELRAEYDARLDQVNRDLADERRARTRVEQARRDEKEWALHLRREVMRLQQERGALGDTRDARRLVLRTALTLVGAEKGLLLSRLDADRDDRLDLVCHEGFENDPSDSAVAQRFAHEVIEKDRTIREDDEPDIAGERRTPADQEIRNLLAIPIYIADDFTGVVVLANKQGGFREYDDDVLLALGDHAGAVLHNTRLREELRTTYVGTVRVLADAIEAKDRFLRGHADEVAAYVAAVADRLGLEPRQREELVYSSLLHDIGKIGISERILMKPAELTPEERSIVQLHPRIGYRLVQQVPALRSTEMAILHHHERWDGDGYPAGLRGDEIPLQARIIAVADAFSAMTADRPYRRRMTLDEACAELERCAGTQFDPVVVRMFVEEVRRRPPEYDGDALHDALADPELASRRGDNDPILGVMSFVLTDNLTLLYSRRYLHEAADAEAHRAAVQGRPFAVVLVELAELARTNAEDGYAAGDEAIQRVASAVQRAAVRCGGTACRYSGRRIALLAPGDEQAADECAGEIANELAGGPRIRVATAVWRPGSTGEDVLRRARAALAAPAWEAPTSARPPGPMSVRRSL